MNWALFFSTFALIFLAELGDKTQLAVMSQSAASSSKWTVFAAGIFALAVSTAVGVLAGDLIRKLVPDERYIKCAGGILFLVFGGLMLREVFLPKAVPEPAPAQDLAGITGWVGKFVIRQAAVFEKTACDDYEALAARALVPDEKAVFQRLAVEEQWHHQAMLSAIVAGAENDILVTPDMAKELPPLEDLMHDAAGAPKEVEHAIRHERAMAAFYRALARQSQIPRLRETFLALAVTEENHARRLMALGK